MFRRILKVPNIHHETSWAEISPQGEILRDEPIPGLTNYARGVMVSGPRLSGWSSFASGSPRRSPFVLALSGRRRPGSVGRPPPRGSALRRVPIGDAHVLVQDEEGRRVYVLHQDDEGVHVVPLGPEAPTLAQDPPDRTSPPLPAASGVAPSRARADPSTRMASS